MELYRKVPNLRILACGGDGTIGWILSILDDFKVAAFPPIAILPLGTGNDLARSLGWGGGYTDEPISKILSNVEDGEVVKLDRWILKLIPNSNADLNNCDEGKNSLTQNVVNNYFSIGVDALIALEFHEAREAHPEKFSSRFWNKMFYGQAGGKDLIQRKWKDLSNFITLECDGQDLTYKLKDLKVHSILFLNIPSYGGGTMPWGSPSCKQFQPAKTDDVKIEVIGLTTYQLPLLQAGGHGSTITQCSKARLVTRCTIPVQIDGEPCRLKPSVIELDHWNTVNMIAKTKKHGKIANEKDVHFLSLNVLKLSLTDYESDHYQQTLKEKALQLGELSASYDADLAEIRCKVQQLFQIDKQDVNEEESENKENIFMPKIDWWFLDSCTADKFYRIDKAQEQLYYVADICDSDLFIVTHVESPVDCEILSDPVYLAEELLEIDESSINDIPPPLSETMPKNKIEESLGEDDLMTAAVMGGVIKVAQFDNQGGDLTATDRDGRTVLHHAAFIGNIEVVRYLVSYGPRILLDMQDNVMYHTALHRAATRRDRVVCSLLVCAGASLSIVDKQGSKAYELAALVGDQVLADYLETMENPVIL